MWCSYLRLHHKGPVHSQIMNNAVHIHNVFPFDLEDQAINGYEGACAPNSSTESKYQNRKAENDRRWKVISYTSNQMKTFVNVRCCVQPAVNHCGGVSGILVHVFSDQMSEADQKLCGFWNAVIRPRCEMEVADWADFCCFHLR